MYRPRLKVGCITTLQDLTKAVAAGVDGIGVVSRFAGNPASLPTTRISPLVAQVPAGVSSFLLTHEITLEVILRNYRKVRSQVIQLLAIPASEVYSGLRRALKGIKLVQVISVGAEDSVITALAIAPLVDALVLNASTQHWQLCAQIVRQSPVPVWLAGDLQAQNLAEAIQTVHPFGVEVCSGVRTAAMLDERKLTELVHVLDSCQQMPPPRGLHVKFRRVAISNLGVAATGQFGADAVQYWVRNGLRLGAKAFLLREALDVQGWHWLIDTLQAMPERGSFTLLVNGYYSPYLGIDGYHLREHYAGDVNPMRDRGLVGWSCHSVASALAAEAQGADYLFFSPVFETVSHEEQPAAGIKALKQVCKAVQVPVFALGGITKNNEARCRKAGAYGVAAISWFA